MIDFFLEKSQYARREVLAWNPDTKLVYTSNGSLYRVENNHIEDLKGQPSDPEERIDEDG